MRSRARRVEKEKRRRCTSWKSLEYVDCAQVKAGLTRGVSPGPPELAAPALKLDYAKLVFPSIAPRPKRKTQAPQPLVLVVALVNLARQQVHAVLKQWRCHFQKCHQLTGSNTHLEEVGVEGRVVQPHQPHVHPTTGHNSSKRNSLLNTSALCKAVAKLAHADGSLSKAAGLRQLWDRWPQCWSPPNAVSGHQTPAVHSDALGCQSLPLSNVGSQPYDQRIQHRELRRCPGLIPSMLPWVSWMLTRSDLMLCDGQYITSTAT